MNKEYEKIFTERGFTNIEQMSTMFDYYKNELERYKNIIDELERWLELIALQYKKNDIDDFAIYENVLIKLKELKGE